MNNIGGYKFKNTDNFELALTHSSFSTDNYERLEFLGDSILDFIVADFFYKSTKKSEGELTIMRANIVSKKNLAKVFDGLNVENYCKMGKSCQTVTQSIKCDMLESILASIYIDGGMDNAIKFVHENFNLNNISTEKDFKTTLQEFCQSKGLNITYKLDDTKGDGHNLSFYSSVYIEDKKYGNGNGSTKHESEQKCAENALKNLSLN